MSTAGDTSLIWSVLAPAFMAVPRILAAVTTAPLFSSALFPSLLRNAFVVTLVLGLYPHLAANLPVSEVNAGEWLLLIAKEVLLGMLIGAAVGAVIWVFESAGAVIDLQVGVSNGMLLDPFGGHVGGPFTALMTRLAVALFVAGGGLYVFVSLLYESFALWPVHSYYPEIGSRLIDVAKESAGSFAQMLVRLAAPVILLLAIVDIGFGLVQRVAPQLNVFFFTMPIKGVLAVLMLSLYLAYLADIVAGHSTQLQGILKVLHAALAFQ